MTQTFDLNLIPDHIKKDPTLLIQYLNNIQGVGNDIGKPLDYRTTMDMVGNIKPQQETPNLAPTITISESDLLEGSSADNPEMFQDAELASRMRENSLNNRILNNYDEEGNVLNPNKQTTDGSFQFFNPYTGTDLQAATFMLGQSIENKDTLGTIGSGLKVATGLGRNFMSGLAFNKKNNQILEAYREKQRKGLTGELSPTLYEDGGEHTQQDIEQQMLEEIYSAISQGMSPEEVLQRIIEMGVDEQTATQMVEFVMQQVQSQNAPQQEELPEMEDGGEYLKQLVGKKITGYKLNKQTGNYEVTYE